MAHTKGNPMRNRYCIAATMILATATSICLLVDRHVLGDNPHMPDANGQQKMESNFFKDAASGNTLEIRLAKLAEERATDPQVKETARMIQNDHEQANQLLKQVAEQHHIDVSTDSLSPVDQAVWDKLQKKEGEDFTRCYIFQQVGGHAQDQLIYSYHATHGQSDACRQYASQVLPKVEAHLHALEQIARPMTGLSSEPQAAGLQMTPEAK